MIKLRHILLSISVLLTSINIGEVGYFSALIARNYQEFTMFNLVITIFINFSIFFFAVTFFFGMCYGNKQLLSIWIIYAIVELIRSSFVVYSVWIDSKDIENEKITNSFDMGVQITSILVVFLLMAFDCPEQVSEIVESVDMKLEKIQT